MTINIQKCSNVNATGYHTSKNCKAVYCITTGEIFASLADAAEANDVSTSAISLVVLGKTKTCNGKRFCYISRMMEHLEEITEIQRIRNEKVAAYDAMIAEQNAKKEAQENLAKHKAKCEELRAKLEKEMQLVKAAEEVLSCGGAA